MKVNSVHLKFIAVFSCILGMLLWSCSGNRTYDQQLSKADSIMDIADDSAQISIKLLDGIKPELSNFSKAQRMRYELLYHKAMNKAYIDFTSDSTMLAVVDYYEHNGSSNDKMLAYYILGCVYRDMREAPLALEYYNKATEQADTASTNCDYATLCRVYNQMGVLFAKQHLPHQELASFDKAMLYAYKAKDTLNAILYYYNKTDAYTYLDNEDSAIIVNINAAKLFRKYGYDRDADIAFGCNYSYYVKKNNKEKAKESFEVYNRTNYMGNTNYADSYAFLLYEKGMFYLLMEQNDSAYYYLQNSLTKCKTYGNKAEATKGLADYYLKTGDYKLAAKYALQSSAYNDSDYIKSRKSQLAQQQAMYDYSRNQNLAIVSEQKAEVRINMIYIIISSSIIILFIIISLYKKQLSLKNKKIIVAQQLYNDCLNKLQLLQEENKKIIAKRDAVNATKLRQSEEAINKLKNTIKDIREKFSGSLMTDVDVILQNSAIYRKIQFVMLHPKEQMEKEDWNELEETVGKLIPCFPQILKNRLSTKEYRICLLIRLKYSPTIIGNVVGLSNSGVTLARKRMLEKVCGKKGTAKELDSYILSLS